MTISNSSLKACFEDVNIALERDCDVLNLVLLTDNPLYTGNPQTGTSTNSEDSDEMPLHMAFHQGLHCL